LRDQTEVTRARHVKATIGSAMDAQLAETSPSAVRASMVCPDKPVSG